MNNKDISIASIIDTFQNVLSKPEVFVSSKESFSKDVKHLLKDTYDFTKKEELRSLRSNALPELIIESFDSEQIWQQIELQNDEVLNKSIANVSKFSIVKDRLLFKDVNEDEPVESDVSSHKSNDDDDENKEDEADLESDEEVGDLDEAEDNKDLNDFKDGPKMKFKPSIVDDEFFKLDEMNNFLISQEKDVNKSNKDANTDSESEESVDMFKEGSEDEDEEEVEFEGNDKSRNPRYKDFFGTRTQQRMEREKRMIMQDGYDEDDQQSDHEESNAEDDQQSDNEESNGEDDHNDNDNGPKSTLELREERLKAKIRDIEEAAVSEKPWQLKGEVTAESRPENSLLQEVLEFDLTSRPAPVITEETTHLLEDVIKQRIKDKAFDDVERKEKPVENILEYKKKLLLDQEKSKESLAQIYEKEYVKQREALNPESADKEEEDPELHKEVKTMMNSLFSMLDALSNFHFTARPAAPELKVVNNLPAISMEEVAPVATTDAALLAPEEIRRKNKGDVIGKGERTVTDKKRERRKKKRKQQEHAKEKEKREKNSQKLKPGLRLGKKYSKDKIKKKF